MASFRVSTGYLGDYVLCLDGDVPTNQEEALKLSIEKWEFIVNWVDTNKLYLYDGNTDTCALCSLYLRMPDACIGCPVMESTGRRFCYGTPYVQYGSAYDKSTRKALEAATQELKFLKSLMEERYGPVQSNSN